MSQVYVGCRQSSKPHPDFRFLAHLSPLCESHLHKKITTEICICFSELKKKSYKEK